MKDALGNDLVVGQVYGYHNKSNSLYTIVTGRFIEMTTVGRAKLKVLGRREIFCGDETVDDTSVATTVNVTPWILFPIAPQISEE